MQPKQCLRTLCAALRHYLSDGIPVHSHNGLKIKFGKEYVLTGLATDEGGKLLSKMESMRARADYDATFTATEAIITERFDQVEQMIHHIKVLIDRTR